MARAADRALRAVPAATQSVQSITAFIAQHATVSGGGGEAWRRWPAELLADIDAVLKHNDANPTMRVTREAFMDRALAVYGVKIGKHALGYYMKTQRARKNWTTK